MVRQCGLLASTAIAALLVSHGAMAQETPPGALGPISAWLAGTQVNGRIEAGVSANPAGPDTSVNFGQLFTDKANQPVLNQFDINAVRPADPRVGGVAVGFAAEGMYGLDSQFSDLLGLFYQGPSERNAFDLVQLNLDLAARPSANLAFAAKAGIFVTPMGFEKLDPTQNFFYSNSYIFNYGLPRKHTGVLTTTTVGQNLNLYLGYDTGENTFVGPGAGYDNGHPHVLGGAALSLRDVTIQAFTHIGPEDSPSRLAPGVDAHKATRYENDLIVTWALAPGISTATELNYVRDDGLKADAGGVAQYLTVALSPWLLAGARAEVWRDAEGAFVAGFPGNLDYLDFEKGVANSAFKAGPATYGEVTVGLNFRPALSLNSAGHPLDLPFGQMILRPEVRYDRVLAGNSDFGGTPGSARDQVTVAMDVVVPLSFQHGGAAAPDTDAVAGAPMAAPTAAGVGGAQRVTVAAAEPAPVTTAITTLPEGPAAEAPMASPHMAPGAATGIPAHDGVVAAGELALANPQTLQDLNGYLPSTTFAQSLSGDVAPYIRGLGDASPHGGQAPEVGLELNGVAIDGAFAKLLDPGAMASVQVSAGPSGLFEGRDASAGVISFSDPKPTRAWGLDASYSLEKGFQASNERLRLDAPVGDTAGVSLSFSHQQRGGYDNNIYTNDGFYGRDETTIARLGFDWSLTPALEANLDVTLAHGDGAGNPLALGDVLDAQQLGGALRTANPALAFNADGSPYLAGRTGPLGVFQSAADQPNGQSLTTQLYDLTLNYDSALGRLTSVTAFLHENQNSALDLDGGCAPSDLGGLPCPVIANPLVGALDVSTARQYRQFSQELRLDHDFGPFAQTRLGGYVMDDQTDESAMTRTAADPIAPSPAAGQTAHQNETSYALFGNLILHPTSRLTVSGGVRWVHDDERYAVADGQAGEAGPSQAGQVSAGRLLSRVELDYKLTQGVSLFADRATGFRPGGLSLASTLAEDVPGQANYTPANPHANDATFGSETSVNYEAGATLSGFGGAVRAKITGYLDQISGMQTPELVLSPGFAEAIDTYIVNLPRVDTKGVDVEGAWRVGSGLTLSGVGNYEHARIINGLVPAAETPVNAQATAGAAGGLYNLTGTPLVRAPDFAATARADYVHEVGPGQIALDLSYDWTSRYALAVSGGQGDYQPAWSLIDFSIGYQRSVYKIAVTVRNILNKGIYANAEPAVFAHSWGQPRTGVVTLEVKF
jgi:outer membrane receptor protein involved in Fe transport